MGDLVPQLFLSCSSYISQPVGRVFAFCRDSGTLRSHPLVKPPFVQSSAAEDERTGRKLGGSDMAQFIYTHTPLDRTQIICPNQNATWAEKIG
jgi:hypothetical protein